jgi:hypothetical protein
MNLDGTVPEDNPVPGSYIWTWGHRNPQGLVISSGGILYSSEHGPSSDDEVNIIEKGRNYGWPDVKGLCNDVTETQFCADSFVFEPIAAWTPTLAVAGTDFYSNSAISGWQNSLLITTLKENNLVALRLSADGRSVVDEEVFFDGWFGRLRDVCTSPDGRVFLAVSNRDGRGVVHGGDDRIVGITAKSSAAGSQLPASDDFSVYPNPLTGSELTIEHALSSAAVLVIYNQVGAEIGRDILFPSQKRVVVSLPDASGVYFIKIMSDTITRTVKILKL